MLAWLAFVTLGSSPTTLELERGRLGIGETGYWAVSDTFLDASAPHANFGRDPILTAGPGRTVLIQFGDLHRAVGADRRVVQAQLVLTPVFASSSELVSAGLVLAPWNEGPGRRGFQMVRPGSPAPDPNAKPATPPGAVSWKDRLGGRPATGWENEGAQGVRDVRPLPQVKLESTEGGLVLSGLQEAVQGWIDRPSQNFGLALRFAGPIDFASSDGLRGRPKLVVTTEPLDPSQKTRRTAELQWGSLTESVTTPTSWPGQRSPVSFKVTLTNSGSELSSGYDVLWKVRGREARTERLATGLSPGQSRDHSLETEFTFDEQDRRLHPVQVEVVPLNSTTAGPGSALTYWMGGKTVSFRTSSRAELDAAAQKGGWKSGMEWFQAQVQWLNEVAFPQSKFGPFPEGVLERLNPTPRTEQAQAVAEFEFTADELGQIAQGKPLTAEVYRALRRALGAPSLLPESSDLMSRLLPVRPSLSGAGDTRDDDGLPPGMGLPEDGWFSSALLASPLAATNLLSRTDVGLLNAGVGQVRLNAAAAMPRLVIVRAVNAMGQTIPNAQIEAYAIREGKRSETPALTGRTSPSGTLSFPSGAANPFVGTDFLWVKATAGGTSDWTWLPAWRAMDESFRGSSAAAILELRFNLGTLAPDESKKLSLNRIVTDSANRLPAQLVALVDGDPKTATELKGGPGSWVEIDLGRDRLVAEIRLSLPRPQLWNEFDIVRFGTSQTAREAVPFARELFGAWAVQTRGQVVNEQTVLKVAGRAVPMRYVRILMKSPESVSVSEIEIIGANAPEGP